MTEIVEAEGEFDEEDLIQSEDMVVTVTHTGYIKRVPLSIYRPQRRGGKGRSGMATKEEDFVTRVFVANTHTPVLFFSSTGMVYKMKVWRLPQGTPQSRGKAMVNLLPLEQGEWITSVMPLPDDEESWSRLNIMFTTTNGTVRRNELSDFVNVQRNGKIAMKLDENVGIVGVQICTQSDDVVLTTADGKTIRFPVSDVRVFAGRASTGVRGIKLTPDDKVVDMAIIRHVDVTPAEARAYLKQANAMRRAAADETGAEPDEALEEEGNAGETTDVPLSPERYAELGAAEQFLLTVTEKGFGKRTSTYEYRTSGRGGQGIIAMHMKRARGRLVASFPVEDGDQVLLVTDQGQLIRCPVSDISIRGRATQGVKIFSTAKDERVVSVEHLGENGGAGNGNGPEVDAGPGGK